jgi:hypothetical protein
MNTRNSLIAAAIFATFAAGASAAFHTADEGVPHNLVAAYRQKGNTFLDFNVALSADEGVPQNLVTA